MAAKKNLPVMVTTELKGVFFGYLEKHDASTATLTQARCCLYWSQDVKGFMGLAATGPSKTCRVGPAVPRITLTQVTAIVEITDAAKDAWEAQPWSV